MNFFLASFSVIELNLEGVLFSLLLMMSFVSQWNPMEWGGGEACSERSSAWSDPSHLMAVAVRREGGVFMLLVHRDSHGEIVTS